MIRWKLLIINLVLLVAAMYLCVYLVDLIKTPYDFDKIAVDSEDVTKKKVVDVPKLAREHKPNLVFFKDIVEKDLFRPDRIEFVEEKKEEKKGEDVDVDQPNFIVRGITIFGETYKAAIVEKRPDKQNPQKRARGKSRRSRKPSKTDDTRIPPKVYKEGDEIDSNWIVKNIYSRRVEFCYGQRCFFVSIYKTYEDEDYKPPKVPFSKGTPKSSGRRSNIKSRESKDFTAEEFKKLIQQGGRRKP